MRLRLLIFALLLLVAPLAQAQGATPEAVHANGVFLVANPALADPNFRHSVILVTQVADGGSVGFIVNRPGQRSLAEILPDHALLKRFTEPIFIGGPVEATALFAVFRAKDNPEGTVKVLDGVSFALAPAAVERVMNLPPEQVRFFNGYAGWAPGQLAAELAGGGWYVLNADPDTVFRKDMDTLWEEMIKRTHAITAWLR